VTDEIICLLENGFADVVAQSMTTDKASTFDSHDMRKLVGYDMTAAAARQVYEAAGIGPM
jgi:hypothetical protein